MNDERFKKLVLNLTIGKNLPDSVYVHRSAIQDTDNELQDFLNLITNAIKIKADAWNIVKFYKRHFKLSLLNYPTFDSYPYPALMQSHTIDLANVQVRSADYSKSLNPPILHRRETFVTSDKKTKKLYKSFTEEGEQIGLYENTRKIGFRNQWEQLIRRKGYFLDETGSPNSSIR